MVVAQGGRQILGMVLPLSLEWAVAVPVGYLVVLPQVAAVVQVEDSVLLPLEAAVLGRIWVVV